MAKAVDDSAQRIAEKGREALRERLREAFQEAAAAHADVLELDSDKLEEMIDRATDRADGLQWRRALALVATEELGIGLGEALEHPAVAQAQELVGAPSYEEGLAAIAEGKAPPAGTGAPRPAEGPADGEPSVPDEPAAAASAAQIPLELVVTVVYLDGLPKLEGEEELELHFSEDGLEIIRAVDRTMSVTLAWSELHDIEVKPRRGRLLRRRAAARVILSIHGQPAEFEARDVEPEELSRQLSTVAARISSGR